MNSQRVVFDAPGEGEPQVRALRTPEGYSRTGCDWGGCDADSVRERWCAELSRWLEVCEKCATSEAQS